MTLSFYSDFIFHPKVFGIKGVQRMNENAVNFYVPYPLLDHRLDSHSGLYMDQSLSIWHGNLILAGKKKKKRKKKKYPISSRETHISSGLVILVLKASQSDGSGF